MSRGDKSREKHERAQRAFADADAALREQVSERDARVAELRRAAEREVSRIEQRVIAPKKVDVSVVELGIGWAVA